MYAIVDIAGQQFKVQKQQKLFVHRLEAEEGSQVEFGEVLLVDNDGSITVGQPHVEGASITAKVLTHEKGDKVLVFKKKRRKGYQNMNGHRQQFTEIEIEDISLTGGSPVKAKRTKKVAEPKAEEVMPAEVEAVVVAPVVEEVIYTPEPEAEVAPVVEDIIDIAEPEAEASPEAEEAKPEAEENKE
jgi:large subunit ribosomal protein L21